jgi:hypothetical protein
MYRIFLPCVLVFLLMGCRTLPRQLDAPRPDDEEGILDFGPLFEDREHVVLLLSQDSSLLKRLLVSPNLVGPAARSAMDMASAGKGTPQGGSVDATLSTQLLAYLAWQYESEIITPAITGRWWEQWSSPSRGDETKTWYERHLVASPAKEAEHGAGVPSAALAVSYFGKSKVRVEVVAELFTDEGDLAVRFRPRKSDEDVSACPPLVLKIPTVSLVAEILEARTGRLIARFNGSQPVRPDLTELRAIGTLTRYKPVARTAYERFGNTNQHGVAYQYVASWQPSEIFCEKAQDSLDALMRQLRFKEHAMLKSAAGTLLQGTLGQMRR